MRVLVKGMRAFLVLIAVLLLTSSCGWGTVHPGERAVFAHWGSLEKWPNCYKEGLYFYNPFTTNMWEVDIKVQKLLVAKTSAASKDLQEVTADIVVNFAIDGDKCHLLIKEVGTDFKDRVIIPAVQEVLKASTAHFPVEKVIQERAQLKDEIVKGLRARLERYHISIHDVALTDFHFSEKFAHAVEQKQVEEQNVTRKEYERQQAEKEGQATLARAQGQAQANLAVAKATAEGNRLILQSLTSDLIQFKAVEKWDGGLPQIMGQGTVPFINLNLAPRKGSREEAIKRIEEEKK